ncbi:MAG: ferrous iron transport protein A [Chloroflexi bacterium]|nr:ferrous iron transport protein A [Chloroflexota bacterium]
MTLDQLGAGQAAVVKKLHGKGAIRRRLMDMGVLNGVSIVMVKSAPLGDPIQYKLLGYDLALRKSEARLVEIEL